MFDLALDESATIQRALQWIEARGIELRPWPQPADWEPPATSARPILRLVEVGAEPPPPGDLEDWLRLPLDRDELYARADLLLARAQEEGPVSVSVDEFGVLRVDDDLVILSPIEADIMRTLVDQLGRLIPRHEVLRRAWVEPEPDEGLLARHVGALRRRLGDLPLEIHSIRGQGLLLERIPPAPS